VTTRDDSVDEMLTRATDEELSRIASGEDPQVVFAARRAAEREQARAAPLTLSAPSDFDALFMRLVVADSILSRRVDAETALVQWENGAALVVARGVAERAKSLVPLAKELIPSGLVVIVIDGDAVDVKAMQGVLPSVVVKRVQVVCAPRGVVTENDARALRKHPAHAALTSVLVPDVETFQKHAAAASATVEAQGAFFASLAQRKPVATYTFAALVALLFGAEHLLGALEFPPMMLRMGALHAESVREGEVWRLLTVALLHGSLMHVIFNTYVFILLGRSLERLLGTSRFTILFLLSVLGGSLLSMQFLGDRQSVGASGGVWGLLAAEAMLVFVRKSFMSPLVLARARATTMQALVLNILYSFQPNVDWAAHAGGGLVGALLVGSGLLLTGVPHFAERAKTVLSEPPSLKVVALGLVTLLIGAGACAALVGDPLALRTAPPLVSTSTEPLGIVFDAPRGVRVDVQKDGESNIAVVGEILRDGFVMVVVGDPHVPPLDGASLTTEIESVRAAFEQGLPGTTLIGAVEVEQKENADAFVISRQRYENGVPSVRVLRINREVFVIVTITHFASLPFDAEALARAVASTAVPRIGAASERAPVEN